MISHPIIQCNLQSQSDYKTLDLSLQTQKKKTSSYLKANLDRKSFKMNSSVTQIPHMALQPTILHPI